MNTSIILRLFALCCVLLAHFPHSAQAAKKKVYFIYSDEPVKIVAEHINYYIFKDTFDFGATNGEQKNGKVAQYLEIDPDLWKGKNDDAKIVFHVFTAGLLTQLSKTSVKKLRQTGQVLNFAG
ncbi:hypothetical protein niasHT_014319 [Heterodera trifolii]|uniref:Effector protein n=1 Tax=Heterodera trifolii TaxID=157864 RepID=A0ABD2L961_9BILA